MQKTLTHLLQEDKTKVFMETKEPTLLQQLLWGVCEWLFKMEAFGLTNPI